MESVKWNVTKIEWYGGAAPYQLEGYTDKGEYFYMRYRNGWLMAGVAEDYESLRKKGWDDMYNVINKEIREGRDGCGNHELFSEHLAGLVSFPEGFIHESFPKSDYPVLGTFSIDNPELRDTV